MSVLSVNLIQNKQIFLSHNSLIDSSISFLPGIPSGKSSYSLCPWYFNPWQGASPAKIANFALLSQFLLKALSKPHAISSAISPPPPISTSSIFFLTSS